MRSEVRECLIVAIESRGDDNFLRLTQFGWADFLFSVVSIMITFHARKHHMIAKLPEDGDVNINTRLISYS